MDNDIMSQFVPKDPAPGFTPAADSQSVTTSTEPVAQPVAQTTTEPVVNDTQTAQPTTTPVAQPEDQNSTPPVQQTQPEWYETDDTSTTNPSQPTSTTEPEAENIDPEVKLFLEYKKNTGKGLADFVKQYQLTDYSKMSDTDVVSKYFKEKLQLEGEELTQSIAEYEAKAGFEKKELVRRIRNDFEAEEQNKLKQIAAPDPAYQEALKREEAVTAKFNTDFENKLKSVVDQEYKGLKITPEMGEKIKSSLSLLTFRNQDGSFNTEAIFDAIVYLTYGKEMVKANVTKARNSGRAEILAEVTNPTPVSTPAGNPGSSPSEKDMVKGANDSYLRSIRPTYS